MAEKLLSSAGEGLRKITSFFTEGARKKENAAKEAAIFAYENDLERNAEGLKIVRGKGNVPVEVIMIDQKPKAIPAIVVDGKQVPVPDFDFARAINSLQTEGTPLLLYSVTAVQRLHYTVGRKQKIFDVLKGVPRF